MCTFSDRVRFACMFISEQRQNFQAFVVVILSGYNYSLPVLAF